MSASRGPRTGPINFGKPDEAVALTNYARLADGYDIACQRLGPIREEAVALLGLRPGDRVLDVGCGTGISFALLNAGVGTIGSVVGVELSPEMCAQARLRALGLDGESVRVIEASAEGADFGAEKFDAVLFHYTHDVLRNPAALAHLFASARPGARVVVAGLKAAPAWAAPLNWFSMFRARKYLTTFEGVAEPWSHLLRFVPDFHWRNRLVGTGYVGWGNAPGEDTVSRASVARET